MKKYAILIAVILGLIIAYYVLTHREVEKRINILLEVQGNIGGKVEPLPGKYFYNYSSVNITLTAYPDEDYIFDYWLINNSIRFRDNPLKLTINGNTSVKPFFKRIYFYIRLESNGTLYLNGSKINTPYILRYREHVVLNISGERRLINNTIYFPLKIVLDNVTVDNPVKISYRNATLKLLYGVERGGEYRILVTSNVARYCYVNGSRVELPTYVRVGRLPFTTLSAEYKLPLNDTYSYYVGWYKVFYRNNQCETISYYGHESIRLNMFMEKIHIYYVRGLKKLPYIIKIHYFPPFNWNYSRKYWQCYARIENNSIVFYNFTNPLYINKVRNFAFATIIFEFDYNVTGIWFEYYPKNARLAFGLGWNKITLSIKFMRFSGDCKEIPNTLGFHQLPNRKYVVFVGKDGWKGENYLDDIHTIGFFDPDTYEELYLPEMYGRYGLFFEYAIPLKPDNGDEYILIFRILGVIGDA